MHQDGVTVAQDVGRMRFAARAMANIALPVAVLVCAMVLLGAASRSSPDAARAHLTAAVLERGLASTDYPDVGLGPLRLTTVDSASECVALGHILASGELPFGDRPSVAGGSANDPYCLQFARSLAAPAGSVQYARFFHGVSALLRVGLNHLALEQIRVATTIVLGVLSTVMVAWAFRGSSRLAAGIFIFLFISTDTLFEGLSLTHGLSTATGLAGVLAAAALARLQPALTMGGSAAAGVAYAVMAQLFVPLEFAILLALLVMTPALSVPRQERPVFIGEGAKACVGWLLGYAGAMLARLAWVRAVLGADAAVVEVHEFLSTRLTSSLSEPFVQVVRLLVHEVGGFPFRAAGFVSILAMLATAARQSRGFRLPARVALQSAMPALFAVLWLLATGGHTGHGWVVQVVQAILLCGLFVVLLNLRYARDDAAPGR